MLRTLSIGKVFTTLDLRGAYNLLRIKKGDEPKTALLQSMGSLSSWVMPFGLANAPAQFQRMMNTLFRDSIGKFVLVYLDDIVIYSENLEKHKEHVKAVLAVLSKNGLYCKLEKCHFHQQEISYLGKIHHSPGCGSRKVNHDLKKAFQTSSFLAHPCDSKAVHSRNGCIGLAISGVLSQFDDSDQIRPVAFYARQMNSAERNYEIYDKELLAIVDSFKHWRHFCKVVSIQSRYFATTKAWSTSCPRRSSLVDRLDGLWSFQSTTSPLPIGPGKLNGRADALSRQSDHHLENDCSNFKTDSRSKADH
ncbi:hypothetical protein BASA83_013261 [Batrachochytrium salamandrivorans]|nr:hypothetical protein BASA83_013261 [Batrachochytrium salamandrivorans]